MNTSLAQRLRLRLAEMRLYEGTGDRSDNGYQEAIMMMEDWLSDQPETPKEEPRT